MYDVTMSLYNFHNEMTFEEGLINNVEIEGDTWMLTKSMNC